MWFSSKQVHLKRQGKGTVHFLRKALPQRQERRVLKQKPGGGKAVLVLWLFFLGTLVYVLFFSPFVFIEHVQITGTHELSRETAQDFVEAQITGKYWGILPKRAYILVRPRVLEECLRAEYPLLAAVSVERTFPSSMRILVTERKYIILLNAADVRYLVDEAGVT
ncbi:MAG: FtsQ-type POTRA domain-containing protein, partial [Candidatus Moraniibacteriota bacterium]